MPMTAMRAGGSSSPDSASRYRISARSDASSTATHTLESASQTRGTSSMPSSVAEAMRASSLRRRERATEMAPAELETTIVELEEEMLAAAEELRFEYAAKLRDEIRELRRDLQEATAPS